MKMRTLLFMVSVVTSLLARGQNEGDSLARRDSSERPSYFHDIFVTNASSWVVRIEVVPKHPSMEGKGGQFMMQPGTTTKVASYSDEAGFVSPVQRMKVIGTVTTRKRKEKVIGVLMMEDRRIDAHHHNYVYHVMGNAGGVGFGF